MTLDPAERGVDPEVRDKLRGAKRRWAKQELCLSALKRQWGDAEYRHLAETHVRTGSTNLRIAVEGTVLLFDQEERPIVEAMIDEYNVMGYDPAFWRRSCADLLDEITWEFGRPMAPIGRVPEGWVGFEVFQLITLNFAQMACEQKELREFMGIRKSFFLR